MKLATATAAWCEHLGQTIDSPLEQFALGSGEVVSGKLNQYPTVADFDLKTPLVSHPAARVDYTALAREAQSALAGVQDAHQLAQSSSRWARWHAEARDHDRVVGAPGAYVTHNILDTVNALQSGKSEYFQNNTICGEIGLTSLAFCIYTYSQQLQLGMRATFNNADLVADTPYDMFVLSTLAWEVASRYNVAKEEPHKLRLGYCRTIIVDGFIRNEDVDLVDAALRTLSHEFTTTIEGSPVDPHVGGRATQREAMHFALQSCERGTPMVGPGWEIRPRDLPAISIAGVDSIS